MLDAFFRNFRFAPTYNELAERAEYLEKEVARLEELADEFAMLYVDVLGELGEVEDILDNVIDVAADGYAKIEQIREIIG